MGDDIELLKLAAVANEMLFKGIAVNSSGEFTHVVVNNGHGTRRFRWNPLKDDGDAFRLAVKLGIPFTVFTEYSKVIAYLPKSKEHPEGLDLLERGSDMTAAARWAIVRAAAEIATLKRNRNANSQN